MKTWNNPQNHFDIMKGLMSQALDDFFSDTIPHISFAPGDFRPAADILESATDLTVVLELPGISKANFSVTIENEILIVSGRRRLPPVGQNAKILLKEIGIGRFLRKFRLGIRIDEDNIEAKLKDGLLTIKLPKARKDS